MIGILCEKPSAAKNFSKALGGMKGIYNNEAYIIVSAVGHIYEFKDPKDNVDSTKVFKYQSWDLENIPWDFNDFKWDKKVSKDKASVARNIKDVLKNCDEIVIATDIDPSGEGQMIGWEIIDNLHLKSKKISRMYFFDEAEKSLQKAFVSRKVLPKMEKDPEYLMSLYRSMWDYMSMQETRIATKVGDGSSVLRNGRLKSAMNVLVGDQLDAIKNYVKAPVYFNKFVDEYGNTFTDENEPVYKNKQDVPNTYKSSEIIIDGKSHKKKVPPKMFDLSMLIGVLSPKGYSSDEVLKVYQEMYISQILSYPRTEDQFISPEQFDEMLPIIDDIADVVGVDKSLLTHRTPRKTHVKTGGAHGANRPGLVVPKSLVWLKNKFGELSVEIYEILALNYLSTICEDYEYDSYTAHLKDYPSFVGTCQVMTDMGYKQIFTIADEDDEDNTKSTGFGKKADPFIFEKINPKPPYPTTKWLMKQLEKRNVGTGATKGSTYSDVKKGKYPLFKETKGKISLTKYGEMNYMLIRNTHIGSLDISESVMNNMKSIKNGQKTVTECISGFDQMIIDDLKVMKENAIGMRKELNVKVAESKYPQKEKYAGVFNGKPVKFTRTYGTHRFTDEECEKLLNGETLSVLGLKSKAGGTYGLYMKLNDKLEYNGRKYCGVENLGFIDSFPEKWCEHVFTDDEKKILEDGGSVFITGCISKKGNQFDANVTYEKNDSGKMQIIPHFD